LPCESHQGNKFFHHLLRKKIVLEERRQDRKKSFGLKEIPGIALVRLLGFKVGVHADKIPPLRTLFRKYGKKEARFSECLIVRPDRLLGSAVS